MLTTGARPVNPIVAMLRVRTKGNGSSAPISKAIRLAFKHPSVKRKSPAYIEMSVTVRSRWVLEDVRCASRSSQGPWSSGQRLVLFLRSLSDDSRSSLTGVLFVCGQFVNGNRAEWIA